MRKRLLSIALATAMLFTNAPLYTRAQTTDAKDISYITEIAADTMKPVISAEPESFVDSHTTVASINEIETSAVIESISTSDGTHAEGDKVPGIIYTLTLNANGGKLTNPATGKKKSAIAYKLTGEDVFVFDETPVRVGYRFIGWNTKKNGKGTAYEPGKEYIGLTQKNKGKVTLYAQWERVALDKIAITDAAGRTSGTGYPAKKIALNVALTENCTYYPKLTTSDKKLATVSYNRKTGVATVTVKPKKIDSTQHVTVTAAYKSVTASYDLEIMPSTVTEISSIAGPAQTKAGETSHFYAVVKGENFEVNTSAKGNDDGMVTWTTSNAKVLAISQDGSAKALKGGNVTVKASVVLANGKIASKSMKVRVESAITGLKLVASKATVPSWAETAVTLKATPTPKGLTGDIRYAIVSDGTARNGQSAVLDGTVLTIPESSEPGDRVVVRAYLAENSEVSAEAVIRVTQGKDSMYFASDFVKDGEVTFGVGNVVHLNPTYKRSGELVKDCTWSLSEAGHVIVENRCMVLGWKEGDVVLTAKDKAGNEAKVTIHIVSGKEIRRRFDEEGIVNPDEPWEFIDEKGHLVTFQWDYGDLADEDNVWYHYVSTWVNEDGYVAGKGWTKKFDGKTLKLVGVIGGDVTVSDAEFYNDITEKYASDFPNIIHDLVEKDRELLLKNEHDGIDENSTFNFETCKWENWVK